MKKNKFFMTRWQFWLVTSLYFLFMINKIKPTPIFLSEKLAVFFGSFIFMTIIFGMCSLIVSGVKRLNKQREENLE